MFCIRKGLIMKKILILSKHIGLGGVTIHTLLLSKYLVKRGYRIYIASSGGYYLEEFKKLRVPHYLIDFKNKSNVILNMINLFILVNNLRPDIIHCQWQINNFYAYFISKIFRIPFISVLHLSDIQVSLFRRISPWGDASIAISTETYEELIYKYHVNKEKITLIYNGVDLKKFTPPSMDERERARQKYNICPDTISISMIARLTEVKGAKYLIEAVSKLRDSYKIKILFAGDGTLRKELELLVKKVNVNAEFFGWIDDVREILCASDIFVLPSLQEGFAISVIEAMAMKVPIIRTKTAGAFDQIRSGYNGILINPGSAEEIKNALVMLIENLNLRELIRKNAYDSVVKKFSAITMTESYIKVYKKILRAKRRTDN